jgi:purine nucleoside permease
MALAGSLSPACAAEEKSVERSAQAQPIEVRVVVVTAFEIGEDTGDRAGEYQAWAQVMPQVIPFPAGFRHLRYDPARKALLLSTGIGTNRAAASTMALGLDPRFDLSHAYWMVAAIAGTNPNTASIGSAAWIGDVVDTDYGYAVDPREAPKDWPAGMFARDSKRPYQAPHGDAQYNLFPLNKGLRDWAYGLTKSVAIPDTPVLQQIRAGYRRYPAAGAPPAVIRGVEASGQTFWHGERLNTHVERWSDFWTGGKEPFVMTAMEDTGVASALNMLGRLGKADPARLLVLRTGSNYSVQAEGVGAAESLISEASGLSALQASLDAAFIVGTPVVNAISNHWTEFRDKVPGDAEVMRSP